MKIEVSEGELIDKYNILQIKERNIKDPDKLGNIQIEMTQLNKYVLPLLDNRGLFKFNILLYINQEIWDKTNIIKSIKPEDDFKYYALLAKEIFDLNQKRFRIKKYFNKSSTIKEEKSYNEITITIVIPNYSVMMQKLPEINYFLIEYDKCLFYCPYPVEKELISILQDEYNSAINTNDPCINIQEFVLPLTIRSIFQYDLKQ